MMRFLVFWLVMFIMACNPQSNETLDREEEEAHIIKKSDPPVAIVIHGGAGTILKEHLSDSLEKRYLFVLDSIISAGHQALEEGEEAVNVVIKVISAMEDSPLFNAGKGAVFTNDGINELDASIMKGKDRSAGAVARVKSIKNPIQLAHVVMERSNHVFLSGDGAEQFAKSQGIEKIDPAYFFVQSRYDALLRSKEKSSVSSVTLSEDEKFGTVGCVALDKNGDIVAGTSTGGMTNKRFGRIGDSPIIGAGTYADNQIGGVSATGWGEFFIRNVVAYDILARMLYRNVDLEQAAREVIFNVLEPHGGDGGVVCLDKDGNVAMVFNTAGMYRAAIDGNGIKQVGIYEMD